MKSGIFLMIISCFLLISCSEEILVDAVDFKVSTTATTFKVGEPVIFTFSGNPDVISFYPGVTRKEYDFKDGRIVSVADSGSFVSFTSAVSGGAQANQLAVLYSTDFGGNYDDLSKVKAATWVDITSSFKLGTSSKFLASENFDLSTIQATGKPIYFAFKYLTKPQEANGVVRNWMIETFAVTSKQKLGTANVVISNQAYAGFRIVDENKTNAPARSSISTTRVSLLGNAYYLPGQEGYVEGSAFNDPQSEHWAISTAIIKDKVDLGPDFPTPLKSADVILPQSYTYTYTTPGTYKATFVASNYSIDEKKDAVVTIDLTITE